MSTIEDLLLKVLRHWLPYYILAWLATAAASYVALDYAWHSFDPRDVDFRRDGNSGHATIDFGGQYLMGKMLLTGNGHQLYNRHVQREVLQGVYFPEDWDYGPAYDYKKEPKRGDVEDLMQWTMGDEKDGPAKQTLGSLLTPLAATNSWEAAAFVVANQDEWTEKDQWADKRFRNAIHPVGGPLYPPVAAFLDAPMALIPVHISYRVLQIFNLVLVFVAAAGARYLARGRVWWPIVAFGIIVFPGFNGSINLGQNATLTLTILVWGWAFAARGRPVLGGLLWGLLAFKPVWALAFFLVPLLSRRWRMCLAMIGTGIGFCLLTLPFVGLQSWFDWLTVGKEAAALYDVDRNWVFLSRDLSSIMRRWLMDWEKGSTWERLPDHHFWLFHRWWVKLEPALNLMGWAMIAFALENTVRLAVLRRRQAVAPDGPPAAFLFLGAWICCFHFMYYDALLGALGVFLLWTKPRRYISPLLVALAPVPHRHRGSHLHGLSSADCAGGNAAAGNDGHPTTRGVDAQSPGSQRVPDAAADPLCVPEVGMGRSRRSALGDVSLRGCVAVVRLAMAAARREGGRQLERRQAGGARGRC